MAPIASPLSLEGAVPSLFKIKTAQIITFSRQLATLLESGVGLLPAMQLLAQQRSSSPPFRRILGNITGDLSTGRSLSNSLSRHSHVFSEVYLRSIEVGERTGRLDVVLKELADHIEKQTAVAKKLKGAMTYPAILLGVGAVVTVVLLTVVLPPLTELFSTFDQDLPRPTKILMGVSSIFTTYQIHLMVVAVLLVIGVVFGLRHPKGQRIKDWVGLYMPLVGPPRADGRVVARKSYHGDDARCGAAAAGYDGHHTPYYRQWPIQGSISSGAAATFPGRRPGFSHGG